MCMCVCVSVFSCVCVCVCVHVYEVVLFVYFCFLSFRLIKLPKGWKMILLEWFIELDKGGGDLGTF